MNAPLCRTAGDENRAARSGHNSALRFLVVLCACAGLCIGQAWGADGTTRVADAALRQRCVDTLRAMLRDAPRAERFRAADTLLALDYRDGVLEAFSDKIERVETHPHDRIEIWSVMTRAAATATERDAWISKIRAVFLDPAAPDRPAALAALARLGYRTRPDGDEPFAQAALRERGPMAATARWVRANSGDPTAIDRLAALLAAADPETRAAAADALGQLKTLSPGARARLAAIAGAAAGAADGASAAEIAIRCAHCVHAPPADRSGALTDVARWAASAHASVAAAACRTLAQAGHIGHRPLLLGLLDSAPAEVRVAAAHALLRIDRRVPHHMTPLDWAVIAAYFVGMLAIGWYYSRRATTTEDYLLAGRNVRSLSAGLSLFASLFSTLSYLAYPGEMIRYGPLYAGATMAALPFVGVIVGWWLIPFIMRLKVTTAYELLEGQLGLGVRTLASFMFLLLRVLWMAALIYATVAVVLVPLLNLDRAAVPALCVFLGLITVIYTAMGGLRAVLLTNVIKAVILFAVAGIALVVVSVRLGGPSAWWPVAWPSHWPEPVWGYDPSVRMSFLGAFVAMLVWFVCTSGSDQMAIQRYLSTQDIRAARRALVSLLVADVLVAVFLSAVGLALSAYFWANPHLVPDGQTILGDSDKLFGRFMAVGFPPGLCGLAITGLLIAAMSSFSSGINSASSVVTVDLLDRFGRRPQGEHAHVRRARFVSVAIGVVVVTLACFVGVVRGNLIELCYKVVNLLVAPLFGLFFMAMFVRRATGFGTLVGAAAGLAVVILISFWEELTGTRPPISFVVAMPASLVVQVIVGVAASLVPVGRRRG